MSEIESDLTAIDEVLGKWRESRISAKIAHGFATELLAGTGLKGGAGLAAVRQLEAVQASEPTSVDVKQAKKQTAPKKGRRNDPQSAGQGPAMRPIRQWLREAGRADLISKGGFVKVEGRRLYAEAHPPKA